jgi:hypothetical protein
LNALGIVAEDQQFGDGCAIRSKTDFLRAYAYIYRLLIFGYEPLGMSLRRLRGRLFMQRLNLKNSTAPQLMNSTIARRHFKRPATPNL